MLICRLRIELVRKVKAAALGKVGVMLSMAWQAFAERGGTEVVDAKFTTEPFECEGRMVQATMSVKLEPVTTAEVVPIRKRG